MRGLAIGSAVLGLALATAAPVAAIGPALVTNPADRDRAVRCPPVFTGAHEPVLFVHGTAGRSEDHWALGYSKILPDLGFDVCTVRLPELALGDIQLASEYVVHAVRAIAERSGKKVDVVGYSQGGLEPRWAIKYWLDVRYLVDDLVTLATPHHGAYSPDELCATGSCHPAVWQMRTGSSFIAALDAEDETPGTIDYTSIYSLDDELVQPAAPTPTAALAGGTNIQIQDVCAGRSVSHGNEPFDAVVYALAVDALTHAGPGDPARALAEHPDLCTQTFMPGLTPDDGAIAQEVVYGNGLEAVGLHPGQTSTEPAPAAYVPEPSFLAGLIACIASLLLLRRRGRAALAIGALGLALSNAIPASADGPTLESSLAARDRAIQCPLAFSGDHEPILFVHGTAGRPEDHWALDYQKILPDLGFDVCTVRLPDFALGDIQTAAEYVVHAVRTIAAASGKPVDIVGYSQGGLEPRWAVKYWPDVQTAVDDIVTLATPHHGTILGDASCAAGSCDPAVWQMRPGANFIASLNTSDETPGAIDYTSIYSIHDELVQPAAPVPTAALAGDPSHTRNILIQDVCAGRAVNHGAEPVDAAVFALVVDALTHPGPADPDRVLAEQPDLCTQTYLPGLTEDDGAAAEEVVYGNGGETFALGPDSSAEPPLRPYATPVTLIATASIGLAALIARRRR
jgi:triacylglycerol esterase/lipase EstA (alpha/beta hydrolase family)